MKQRYLWLLVIVCLLFIGLSAYTVYISLQTKHDIPSQIERSLATYRLEDTMVTNELIGNAVPEVVKVEGPQGLRGAPGNTIVGPQGPAGKDGKDGESVKGDKGDPGIPGREIELTRDGESLFWRYVDDDFWTEL